jgi:N-acetylmuramoyl-L-alanine amidase
MAQSLFKLYLDPGHGGTDPGAVGNGLKEKDITLTICLKIRDILALEYEGVAVKMSRTGDTYPTLPQRTKEANNWGANFFLSVHINSGGGTGFETLRYPGANGDTAKIQSIIHDEIMKVIGLRDRGKKEQDVHVLRESNMPAGLTESGFIDSANDSVKMKDEAWLDAVARAHVTGLEKAFNLKRKVITASSSGQGATSEKGDDIMSQKFEPSIEVLRNGVRAVLVGFEQQDPALSQDWRLKFDRGELSISDGLAILFEAINRGYIPRKEA